jgi:hypothetical protein
MPDQRQSEKLEVLERRAIERDLVAQLSPDKKTRQNNRHKAEQLRLLLDRINKRKRENQ